jgi:hypothetical protein
VAVAEEKQLECLALRDKCPLAFLKHRPALSLPGLPIVLGLKWWCWEENL